MYAFTFDAFTLCLKYLEEKFINVNIYQCLAVLHCDFPCQSKKNIDITYAFLCPTSKIGHGMNLFESTEKEFDKFQAI